MTSVNLFDLLGDDDNDDPSQLIAAAQQQKITASIAAVKKPAAAAAPASAKLPSKPVPPSQAVREAKNDSGPRRGGDSSRGGFGRGRGGRGGAGIAPNRDFGNGNMNGSVGGYNGGGGGGLGGEDLEGGKPSERGRGGYGPPRQSFRGGHRGGYDNGEREGGGDSDRPPRRMYERRSGTGRGYEMKREGAGRGNWGTATDDVIAQETENNVNTDEKVAIPEKQLEQENGQLVEGNKDSKETTTNETEEKEPEDKEMTLDEYEKIKEEKRKALLAMKAEERKVNFDKEFESMQQLSLKKDNDDIFVKLGSVKEAGKRRENADREERVKKSVSINEFLKPSEGERYYSPGGRGRGRGRGDRGPFRGGFGGGSISTPAAPSIEDPGQFPTLGGK